MAGFLYAYLGLSNAILLVISLLTFTIIFSFFIKRRKAAVMQRGNVLKSLGEGFRFVYKNKILYYAVLLDIFFSSFDGDGVNICCQQ